MFAVVGWSALGAQGIDIYYIEEEGETAAIKVYEDTDCVDGVLSEGYCANVNAEAIAADIREVLNIAGGPIGVDGPVRAYVYNRGYDKAGSYDLALRAIKLPRNWEQSPRGVVHHETGHAVFDEYLRGVFCNAGNCTLGVVKKWGTDEGIAMVFQEAVGGGSPGTSQETVDAIVEKCDINGLGGAQRCAHELGRLVNKRFQDLANERGQSFALGVYMQALRNMTDDVTPDTFNEQVTTEIERIDDDEEEDDHGGEDEEDYETNDMIQPPEGIPDDETDEEMPVEL